MSPCPAQPARAARATIDAKRVERVIKCLLDCACYAEVQLGVVGRVPRLEVEERKARSVVARIERVLVARNPEREAQVVVDVVAEGEDAPGRVDLAGLHRVLRGELVDG